MKLRYPDSSFHVVPSVSRRLTARIARATHTETLLEKFMGAEAVVIDAPNSTMTRYSS